MALEEANNIVVLDSPAIQYSRTTQMGFSGPYSRYPKSGMEANKPTLLRYLLRSRSNIQLIKGSEDMNLYGLGAG